MVTIHLKQPFPVQYFDKKALNEQRTVCGIDEVGRGSFFGPVVTSAVILQAKKIPSIIKDSKLLSAQELITAYEWIIQHSKYAIGITSHTYIDKYGIYQATLHAMKRALMQLQVTTSNAIDLVLVDAMPLHIAHTAELKAIRTQDQLLEEPWGSILYFNYGETRSKSIAAASIVAKVTRDRLLAEMGESFPQYELGRHKGYGTAAHQAALQQHGMSILHRTSYTHRNNNLTEQTTSAQQTHIF